MLSPICSLHSLILPIEFERLFELFECHCQMAEEWLDPRALKAIKEAANRTANAIANLEDDTDLDVPVPKPSRSLDPRKLTVALPETSDIQTIEYVAPELKLEATATKTNSVPDFITPEPRFDVFEHFQYEWIAIPEFEQS